MAILRIYQTHRQEPAYLSKTEPRLTRGIRGLTLLCDTPEFTVTLNLGAADLRLFLRDLGQCFKTLEEMLDTTPA